MDPLALIERLHAVLAIVILVAGLWAAAAARPIVKRVAGAAMAFAAGALMMAAAGGAAGAAAAALALVLGLAWTLLGAALAVRLREAYGAHELDDIETAEETRGAADRAP